MDRGRTALLGDVLDKVLEEVLEAEGGAHVHAVSGGLVRAFGHGDADPAGAVARDEVEVELEFFGVAFFDEVEEGRGAIFEGLGAGRAGAGALDAEDGVFAQEVAHLGVVDGLEGHVGHAEVGDGLVVDVDADGGADGDEDVGPREGAAPIKEEAVAAFEGRGAHDRREFGQFGVRNGAGADAFGGEGIDDRASNVGGGLFEDDAAGAAQKHARFGTRDAEGLHERVGKVARVQPHVFFEEDRDGHRPSSDQSASTRAFTSGDILISSGQRRVTPSPGHLRVASMPILEP